MAHLIYLSTYQLCQNEWIGSTGADWEKMPSLFSFGSGSRSPLLAQGAVPLFWLREWIPYWLREWIPL